jgi:hypothetical protein
MDWLVVGDFNLYRNPQDRNKPMEDYTEMMLFNGAIRALGLVELPLKDQGYTWNNKQQPPLLLECLDWFFTSSSWTTVNPNTMVATLTMETYYHVPCLIYTTTNIPRGYIFRFENYWLELEDSSNRCSWLLLSLSVY